MLAKSLVLSISASSISIKKKKKLWLSFVRSSYLPNSQCRQLTYILPELPAKHRICKSRHVVENRGGGKFRGSSVPGQGLMLILSNTASAEDTFSWCSKAYSKVSQAVPGLLDSMKYLWIPTACWCRWCWDKSGRACHWRYLKDCRRSKAARETVSCSQ